MLVLVMCHVRISQSIGINMADEGAFRRIALTIRGRDAGAAYRPRCEEEQGHQKKEKNLQNRRPS